MPTGPVFTECLLLASLVWGQPAWWVAVLAIVLLAAGLVATTYARTHWPARLKWPAAILKWTAFALIAVCLLEPLWSGTRARPGENLLLVVVDSSASLGVADGPDDAPRHDEFSRLLFDEQLPWQTRLAQDFRLRRFTVADRVDAVETFDGLQWDGTGSAVVTSLDALIQRYESQPVAAVLLFTDGNATDATAETLPRRSASGPPIFPVLPVTHTNRADVAIERTSVTHSSFEDAPVAIQADVRATGEDIKAVTAELLNPAGEVIEQQRQPVNAAGGLMPFRFHTRPPQAVSHYRIQVTGDSGEEPVGSARLVDELTLVNNERLVTVEREPGPYRVLYVAGRPNWEFKFLRRALSADLDVNLVGLIRMAKREAKFEFLGRDGESSNPLFRGFRKAGDEETESYDEPVIIAVGVEDERELTDEAEGRPADVTSLGARFPRTAEELFRYHAIIIDDLEAEFFSHDQLALLERFVAVRGGGLLMLGGPGSFHHGGWQKTIVKDVLPVYIDRAPAPLPQAAADPPLEQRLQLTRDGWLQPWVRLRPTESEERKRLDDMTGFQVVSRVNGLKPAARVLASVVDARGNNQPALVAQQYGDGRGAALLVGDLWRWSLDRSTDAPDDAARSWRQLVRWLVSDVPRRVETAVDWSAAGETKAVTFRVRVRSPEYQPQENSAVQVEVTPPEGSPLNLTAEPSLEEPGLFTATYVPRAPGAYTARIAAADANGKPLGGSEVGWSHEPQADEFRRLGVHRELMLSLAESTGGELLSTAELEDFAASLPSRDVPVKEASTAPLWHSPWMLGCILLLLAGEWALRRWKGLP
ncbi:MAG: hypothetical protein R3B90_02025 [Planctomycetaceae bacterium]